MDFRIEVDSIGEMQVPADAYWGAQTQRSVQNFSIGSQKMPMEIIRSYAIIKKSAALTNAECNVLDPKKAEIIANVCDEILDGKLDDQFPLAVWQTGSGTQTNMNVNEVIANRGHVLSGGKLTDTEKILHPNDHVNRSQSSNDTFPTAMHIASYTKIVTQTLPHIELLQETLRQKSEEFVNIVKIGRTHCMDATPLTLGQEFSAFSSQLEHAIKHLRDTLPHLAQIAIGGTAVGTGLNTPQGYREKIVEKIYHFTHLPFTPCQNTFAQISSHDAIVQTHGALKSIAVTLMKIGNDIRLLSSGPRCGIGEITLPANEPGSSIMPGKVNPTQCEALTMVCAQVMGNDVAVSIGGSNGQFQLNVFKPMMAYNILFSAQILGDACQSFAEKCVSGIHPHEQKIEENLQNSLMLVTSLTPHIGYESSARIAKYAHENNVTLKDAALKLQLLTETEFNQLVDPKKMTGGINLI